MAGEALQCASIAFGICIAMFSRLVDGTTQDAALQELLLLTDNLRKAVEKSTLREASDDPPRYQKSKVGN
ncbi:hypothetical protein [Sphingomonas sp.]|uniref:hypothetical protein n=1 Tax=Sphingomonas sp. TaxID=28214 RepID=UPI003AFFEE41